MTDQEAWAQAFENGRQQGDKEGYERGLREAVRHGRWKPYHEADIGYDEYGVRCSNCGFEVEDHEVKFVMRYCPKCGAKMDGGTNHDR